MGGSLTPGEWGIIGAGLCVLALIVAFFTVAIVTGVFTYS